MTVPTDNVDLLRRFWQRMESGLVANNVLRGAWAEELVGHYLGVDNRGFSSQWDYFDFVWLSLKVSVKHSVGPKARFSIQRSAAAWLTEDPATGRGRWSDDPTEPLYWCDLYVFAHLPDATTLERILQPAEWRFAVCTRKQMMTLFEPTAKTVGHRTLAELVGFVTGDQMLGTARSLLDGA